MTSSSGTHRTSPASDPAVAAGAAERAATNRIHAGPVSPTLG